MNINEKRTDVIHGDSTEIKSVDQFDFNDRAKMVQSKPERKLPPIPGRAPSENLVPIDEILSQDQSEKTIMKYTIKDCIQGTVKFQYYRSGVLYYKCENGFIFPVPIDDTDDAAFNAEDKGIIFMRWIRKALTYYKEDL
jgi:hypothetical protein